MINNGTIINVYTTSIGKLVADEILFNFNYEGGEKVTMGD